MCLWTSHLLYQSGYFFLAGQHPGRLQKEESGRKSFLRNSAAARHGTGAIWEKYGGLFGRTEKESTDRDEND